MLEGGEDPRFIARRMVILASEDIGNADPQALLVADAAGPGRRPRRAARVRAQPRPGRRLPGAGAEVERLLQGARARARADVREHGAKTPPDYLRDAHYPGAKKLGRGEGYVYPHDEPGGVADQPLLPEEVQGERFYEPTDRGFEAELARAPGARSRRAQATARETAAESAERLGLAGMEAGTQPGPRLRPSAGAPSRIESRRLWGRSSPSTPPPASWSARSRRSRPSEVQAVVDDVAEVQPFWAQLSLADRARYMRRAADVLVDEMEEVADLLTREQGKPITESYVMELIPTIDALHWCADAGPEDPRRREDPATRSRS